MRASIHRSGGCAGSGRDPASNAARPSTASSQLTVSDYMDRWLREKERHLERTTIERKYRYCLEKHIKPRIGRVKLEKLKPMQVQVMVGEVADAAGVPTANNCRRVLFTGLRQAVRWQLL